MGLQEAPWANSTTHERGAVSRSKENVRCREGAEVGAVSMVIIEAVDQRDRAEEYPIEDLNGATGRGSGVASLQAATTFRLCDCVKVSGLQFSHLSLSWGSLKMLVLKPHRRRSDVTGMCLSVEDLKAPQVMFLCSQGWAQKYLLNG